MVAAILDSAPERPYPGYGFFWTVAPALAQEIRRARIAHSTPFTWSVDDPALGAIPLTGQLDRPASSTQTLCVLVHGLGGSPESGYVRHAAKTLLDAGMATLRVGLRGTDGRAPDFYHANLTADLHGALADPALASYTRLFIVGFSLGGQLVLCSATEALDPRVIAVAAVCPPLDLAAAQAHLDGRRFSLFKPYLVAGLRRHYRVISRVARAQGVRLPLEPGDAHRLRSVYDFDQYMVVPRFGFGSVPNYYAQTSVGPRLGALGVPALIVAARHDPMVPYASLEPFLRDPGPQVTVRITEGGHVGFPRRLDLGIDAPLGLIRQIAGWFEGVGAAG